MQDSWRQSIPSPPCGLGKGEYIPFLFHQTWVPAKERLACYSLTGCLLNWANKYLCLDSVAEVGSVLRGIWLESSEVWRLWENRKCAHFWCGDFEIRASARKDSGADLAVVCKGVKKKKNGDTPTPSISTSLGRWRKRLLDSPCLYMLKTHLAIGEKWDALPTQVVMTVYHWWGLQLTWLPLWKDSRKLNSTLRKPCTRLIWRTLPQLKP